MLDHGCIYLKGALKSRNWIIADRMGFLFCPTGKDGVLVARSRVESRLRSDSGERPDVVLLLPPPLAISSFSSSLWHGSLQVAPEEGIYPPNTHTISTLPHPTRVSLSYWWRVYKTFWHALRDLERERGGLSWNVYMCVWHVPLSLSNSAFPELNDPCPALIRSSATHTQTPLEQLCS